MNSFRTRRWFRFSLRSLLLVVTVAGIWLGWNVNVVQRRMATIAALRDAGCEIDDELTFPGMSPPQPPQIPLVRRLLGDRVVWGISFSPECSGELIERFDRQFPETPEAYRVY